MSIDHAASTEVSAEVATAAATGANATERFTSDKQLAADTPPERVSLLARQVLSAVHDTIREHKVTYDEYNALKAWLINVGQTGEWPLFLDVWVEHVVEEVAGESREGSKGTIEGPFYVPGAPELGSAAIVPTRDSEQGTPLLFQGKVTSVDGNPLPHAVIEIWHADSDGFYSQFAPGIPEWNLRGTVTTDDQGQFWIHTIRPAPYQIPTDGACGNLISAAGWHPWRPAHLHLKVAATGHQQVTTQLYFPGDVHNEDDVANAVKPELMLDPREVDGGHEVTYDFVLDKD
ncbi:catechol 1,2-dioxygenase [Rhodococcus sp. 1R11]|uniref:catechol 1,2-dioxygenase n=1 Tax=Rhodococcus sp. 1R11 TaxID=2559614 RepID=UPI001071813B|nr:catechol 1,2-dioxygenase [Rhodococcus sp. 1R11]TFI42524.1 catechol 1,2-dioxygenase [Rhodococcus sp. 1R11]